MERFSAMVAGTAYVWDAPIGADLRVVRRARGGAVAALFARFSGKARAGEGEMRLPAPADGDDLTTRESVPDGPRASVTPFFADDAVGLVERACALAADGTLGVARPWCVLRAAMERPDAAGWFERIGVSSERVEREARARCPGAAEGGDAAVRVELSPETERALVSAFSRACSRGSARVEVSDVFESVAFEDAETVAMLRELGVDEDALAREIERFRVREEWRERRVRAEALGVAGAPLIGRDRELESLLAILRSGARGAVLVGPSGIGKRAMLAGLAERLARGEEPEPLAGRRAVAVEMPGSDGEAGMWEAEIEASERAGNAILLVPEIDRLGEIEDRALADAIARRSILVVATATPRGYASVSTRPALRALERLAVSEPTQEEAADILDWLADDLERTRGVLFVRAAVERAVGLADRYLYAGHLPSNARAACAEAADSVAAAARVSGVVPVVTPADIDAAVFRLTGIRV